jgi:adenine specific DNA methylase Mod
VTVMGCTPNKLYLGDNLEIIKKHLSDESISLVYLDPPFKSGKNYKTYFIEKEGVKVSSKVDAFEDKWKWNEHASYSFETFIRQNKKASHVLESFRDILGKGDMLAYLSMMAPRLVEFERVIKQDGTIYLHCDPVTSHYLKILMDCVFGRKSFANEIIWHYRRWTNSQKQYQKMHDVILFYKKGREATFNLAETTPMESQRKVVEKGWNVNKVKGKEGKVLQLIIYDKKKAEQAVNEGKLDTSKYGRIIYRDTKKSALSDTWTDIKYIHSQAKERMGYPTQKPVELLKRIIQTSTNPGDLVLDPFCGCGTTLVAAQELKRKWVGIDKNELAGKLCVKRFAESGISEKTFEVL